MILVLIFSLKVILIAINGRCHKVQKKGRIQDVGSVIQLRLGIKKTSRTKLQIWNKVIS